MNKRLNAIVLIIAVCAGLLMGYQQLLPPKTPRELDESPITLSQAQAAPDLQLMLSHIRHMAGQVHSVGSPGIDITQNYLKQQISAMGYAYQEERYELSIDQVKALLQSRWDDPSTEEEIRSRAGMGDKPTMDLNNISVLVDAPDTDETIIFMAHTDSVIMGPGAFDDTVAVAALLEGLRAIQGKVPARDLIFLFTDGEEQGLLGAGLYVQDHPELQSRTRLVVNLEARGNRGVLILFETSANNHGLISAYQQAVNYPFSTAIATAVYKTMQNDTDLTRFIKLGYPGINLAVIDGAEVYHTEFDNYDTFSRDSAMHYLDNATGLVTYLPLTPALELEAQEDAVHFPLLQGNIVVMPQRTANLFAWAAFILTVVMAALLIKSRRVRMGSMLGALGMQALSLVATGGLSYLLIEALYRLGSLDGRFFDFLHGTGAHSLFLGMLICFALFTSLLYLFAWRRTDSPLSFGMGVLLMPAILALATTFLFPAASYLFSLPVLGCLLAALLGLMVKPLAPLFAGLSSFLVLIIFLPIAYLFYIALGIYNAFIPLAFAMIPLTMITGQVFNTKE